MCNILVDLYIFIISKYIKVEFCQISVKSLTYIGLSTKQVIRYYDTIIQLVNE